MKTSLSGVEFDAFVARLGAQLEMEGWVVPEARLHVLTAVLPTTAGSPDASIVTDDEAAFVVGDALVVASWRESDRHLVTDVLSLPGTPLTIVWDSDWLAEYGLDETLAVPAGRPITVTFRAGNGAAYALPFEAAWVNPDACIRFASTLIARAQGFRPAVDAELDVQGPRNWKR